MNEELKDAAEEVVVDEENDDSNQGISSSEIVNKVDDKKVETVHAIALFENLPSNTLMEDDLQSLNKFIFSETHLKDNIETYEYKVISNFEVSLKFVVRMERLWESGRQYLWKHLGGENYWDRQNGTRIRIKRIHVK